MGAFLDNSTSISVNGVRRKRATDAANTISWEELYFFVMEESMTNRSVERHRRRLDRRCLRRLLFLAVVRKAIGMVKRPNGR
jgi:hypothetical protein